MSCPKKGLKRLTFFCITFALLYSPRCKVLQEADFLKDVAQVFKLQKRRQTCREEPKWLKFSAKNSRNLLANFMLSSEYSQLLLKVLRPAYTAFHSGFFELAKLHRTKTKVNLGGHTCHIKPLYSCNLQSYCSCCHRVEFTYSLNLLSVLKVSRLNTTQ